MVSHLLAKPLLGVDGSIAWRGMVRDLEFVNLLLA